eukprot:UN26194
MLFKKLNIKEKEDLRNRVSVVFLKKLNKQTNIEWYCQELVQKYKVEWVQFEERDKVLLWLAELKKKFVNAIKKAYRTKMIFVVSAFPQNYQHMITWTNTVGDLVINEGLFFFDCCDRTGLTEADPLGNQLKQSFLSFEETDCVYHLDSTKPKHDVFDELDK